MDLGWANPGCAANPSQSAQKGIPMDPLAPSYRYGEEGDYVGARRVHSASQRVCGSLVGNDFFHLFPISAGGRAGWERHNTTAT